MLLLLTLSTAEAKKPKAPPPPPVNAWGLEEGAKGQCFFPADFEKLGDGDRKLARQSALEAMTAQWRGSRDDGVQMEESVVEDIETTLLGRPALIEDVSRKNLEQCKAFMHGGPIEAWKGWLVPLSGKLNAGECLSPLVDTMFDYLEITRPFFRSVTVCKGDRVHIRATIKDRYRISDTGEWMTVEGNPAEKAIGADYPCNIEGCMVGMLVGRFTGDDGVETIFPIGADHIFAVPSNGKLSWSINDTTWYDNKYFQSATIEDRVAVTVEPAE
jgi:hypothetical protein